MVGFARFTWRFDQRGALIDEAAFGADGRPVRLQLAIASIAPGGQAQRLGLQVGDVLLSYAGEKIVNRARLTRQRLAERPTDTPRELKVLRRGEIRTFAISPGLMGVTLAQRAVAPVPEPLPKPDFREP
jgi:S1-C subfamily serine protease